MGNPETTITLEEGVLEVLALLTGLDLHYDPELDRFRAVARQINRALRAVALEKEWSYYSSVETVATAYEGQQRVVLRSTVRPRVIGDDSIRLVDCDAVPVVWAYLLPRDALHKYRHRHGLWASITNNVIEFSRPFNQSENELEIQVPVMREPTMFRLPSILVDDPTVPPEVLAQEIDFQYPDLVIARAAHMYAQTDPLLQPRVQTLEAAYKDLMYQIIERDDRMTDSPYMNDFVVPVQNGLHFSGAGWHGHPHASERF